MQPDFIYELFFLNFLLIVTSFTPTQAIKIILYYSWTMYKPCPGDTYILEGPMNALIFRDLIFN